MIMTPPDDNDNNSPQQQQHEAVILFYKYVDPRSSRAAWLLHRFPEYYLEKISDFQNDLCRRLGLKGRILLASEGINGTLSGKSLHVLKEYRDAMERFDLIQYCGLPPENTCSGGKTNGEKKLPEQQELDEIMMSGGSNDNDITSLTTLFGNIDWKKSILNHHPRKTSSDSNKRKELIFPDIKISIVKELVSTGGSISVEDIAQYGGIHLSPEEFHQKIEKADEKAVVLIDVRNTFEYDIGHFVYPKTNQPAVNPEMVTFSAFEPQFCERRASELKDKTVLMYCTGGIRCEKASIMLKKRGVNDVYQLNGGIHRYLETFGEKGFFQGRNFVFDQRIAVTPAEQYQKQHDRQQADTNDDGVSQHIVVGKCVECCDMFDEISGSRLCTVCRDLVLVCPTCQSKLREYHCRRHADWKDCYFTFLDIFNGEQLAYQKNRLEQLVQQKDISRRIRQSIRRQLEKVTSRLHDVQADPSIVNPNAPRRCRSCMKPSTECNGLCWGFWKDTPGAFNKPKATC